MNRLTWKCLLIGAVAAASLTALAPSADAHWGYYSSWGCCYTPAYSVAYSPSFYDGGYYLGVRPGPIRRWIFGPYRTYWAGYGYGYGYGYYGNCCYPTVSYSPCCYDGYVGGVAMPAVTQPGVVNGGAAVAKPGEPTPAVKPVEKPVEKPAAKTPYSPLMDDAPPAAKPGIVPLTPDLGPEKPATKLDGLDVRPGGGVPGLPPSILDGTYQIPTQETSGLLTVAVPFNAKVFINGMPTTSTGSKRQFVSYGLKPGLAYKYEVRAEWIDKGQLFTETQSVILTAGSREGLALNFNPPPPPRDEDLAHN